MARTKSRDVTSQAETVRGIEACREDMREYTKRDLDEHAELRSAVRDTQKSVENLATHVADTRVEMGKVSTQLGTFIQTVQATQAKQDKVDDVDRENKLDKKKSRRAAIIAAFTTIGGILGAIVHHFFS